MAGSIRQERHMVPGAHGCLDLEHGQPRQGIVKCVRQKRVPRRPAMQISFYGATGTVTGSK